MNLREQLARAIRDAKAVNSMDNYAAADAVLAVLAKQEPVAWCATDESGTVVEALGMNQSRRFDTPLYLTPIAQAQPAPSVPDGWKEGVEAAARLIDQKAELYAIRFGIDDFGGLSFGQGPHAEIKMDHYTSMIELADEVRAMLAAAPKPEESK